MKPTTKAHLALAGTNLFFAINLSAVKYFTTRNIAGPYGINLVRIGVSVLIFWIMFLFKSEKVHIERKDIGRLLLCSVTALALNQMLFMEGLYFTYPIHASLLLLITPILITFIAAWMLKERITILKIAGLFLGVSGAVMLVSSRSSSGIGSNVILGDLLILSSSVAYTFYFILVKPLMSKYPYMIVMRWVFTFGLFMILPLSWHEFEAIPWKQFNITEYLLMFLIVVPGTFLAYVFNAYGIKVLSASIAGTYIYSLPFFAAFIAVFFMKEPLELYKILAAILIFSGVYLANKKPDGIHKGNK